MASDGSIKITTDLDTSAAQKAMKTFGKIASTGLKGTVTAVTAVSGAISAVGGYAIKTGAEFESAMSRVQAISGATGKEFDALKRQAMELGASTAFSASEAAEGMENLASAGFNTNEIMAAMPGMLDLAASSGEDLASSADIAASTLRGFGLEAEQAGHVADVLAKNAADTNAAVADTGEAMKYAAPVAHNFGISGFGLEAEQAGHVADVLAKNAADTNAAVADTGEAMKYAAPVAHNFGISMEECAAAIGIMSDAGIKGGQAGTSLRGALSRLAKPTDDMKEIMNKLGLEFFDSNGKMISLTEQTKMLSEKMSNLTDEERNNALVTLYGQESLSGMLALVQAGSNKIASLTESYKNCDGAAAEMAKTMQDNLKASLEQVGGAAETFGIKVYESMSDDLKSAADTASESINQITGAFENGGLKGAVEEAGDVFAELSVDVANQAPKMVDSAVTFMQAFAGGIYDNRKQLVSSAGVVASTIAEGLAELLPASVREPVKNAIDEIEESFSNGGLKDAAKTVSTTIENFEKGVSSVAKVALPPFTKGVDLLGRNLDKVVPVLVAGYTALKGYGVAKSAANTVSKLSKAYKAATVAVKGYVVAGGAEAVVTAASTGALTLKQIKSAANTVSKLSKAYKAATVAVKGYVVAGGAEAVVTAASTGALTLKQIAVGLLSKQLSIATAAQAAFNAAANANPVGLVVGAVAALTAGLTALALTSKDSTVEMYSLSEGQKKVLESCKETTEAMKEQREAREESVQSIDREYNGYSSLLTELQSITDANGHVKAGYEDRAKVITGLLSDALGIEIDMMDGVIQKYDETIASIQELITQKKAEATINSMQDDMAKAYEKTSEAMEKYKDASAKLEEQNKKVAEAQEKLNSAQEDWEWAAKNAPDDLLAYENALESAKDGLKKAEEGQRKLEKSVNDSKNEINSFATEINNYDALVSAMASGSTEEIEQALNALVTSYKSYTAEALASSGTTRQEMFAQANGYVENMKLIQDGTLQVADSVYQDMANAAINSINEFNKLPGGVAAGIEAIGPEASAAMVSALTQADIDGKLDAEAAINSINEFNKLPGGVAAGIEAIGPEASAAMVSALTQADIDGKLDAEGKASMENLINAVSGSSDEVKVAILTALKPMLDETQYSALVLKINGENATGAYAGAVSSKEPEVREAAGKIAGTAEGELSNAEAAKSLGSDFGSGYAIGISGTIGAVANAAQLIANAALEKTRQTQNSNSPAKESMYLGEDYGDGYALGIDNKKDFVGKTSAQLTDTALKSLNLDELHEKMKGIDIPSTMQEVYSVVNQKQLNVSEKIISEIEGKLNVSQRREQMQVKMCIDIPSTMQEVYSVVNQKQLNVSEKIISEIEGKLNVSQRREQMQVKMSDDDLAKIGREFAKSSSGLIVDALVKSDLKMEMYGERVGRLTTETIDNRLAVANMKARRRTI